MNVQEWGCFSNFLRADDITRTGQCPSKGGGVLVKNPVSAPGPPPPLFKNPGSAPAGGGSGQWSRGTNNSILSLRAIRLLSTILSPSYLTNAMAWIVSTEIQVKYNV